MTAKLLGEIRTHSSDFTSADVYDHKSVCVSYRAFAEMKVITLMLTDDSGHSAKRDLVLVPENDFERKLMSREFEADLVECLETLNEALKEMI